MFKQRVGELAKRPHIVAADAPVAQACDVMAREGVSCLAAVRGARVVGFVTEGALIRRLDVDLDPAAPVHDFFIPIAASAPRDLAVSEAVKTMLEHRQRLLPVTDLGGGLLGVVTERELVDALAVDFMVENVACRTIMRTDPVTLAPTRPVREALSLMRLKSADCVLAVEAGRPVGIFSERDASVRLLGRPERLAESLAGHMSAPVIGVPVEAMVYKVILFMRQKKVRRLAILEADGSLAGLLTQRDILSYSRRMV